MATVSDFQVGNGGSILHIQFKKKGNPFSLVGCTKKLILMRKKDGTVAEMEAEYEPVPDGTGDGSDGKVRYVFSIADLDQAGEWKAQGFARFDDELQVYSSIITFSVGDNLAVVAPDVP